jgi:threonyl-tRNA synthetase
MKNDIKSKEEKSLEMTRHSLAHIMAFALKRIYKNVSFGIGPSNENGFYYDVLTKKDITEEDLVNIEKEMIKIINEDLTFVKKEVKISDAIKLFTEIKQEFKVELLNDLKNYGTTDQKEIEAIKAKMSKKGGAVKTVNLYILGNLKKDFSLKDLIKNSENIFIDLCRGPHIKSSKMINASAFKLIEIAGAYFRGSEKNKMLKRIYGVAFNKEDELNEYLKNLEEAKKRDHNKIGRELEYFTTTDYIGQGLPIIMPKGAKVLQILQRFVEDEEEKRGYLLTKTPLLAKKDLYMISGH